MVRGESMTIVRQVASKARVSTRTVWSVLTLVAKSSWSN